MTRVEIRERMEELKTIKLACIRKGDFLNAAMIHNRITFYNKQLSRSQSQFQLV